MRRHLIYVYVDPRDGEVFYVGQSTRGLDRPREFGRHYAWCLNKIKKIQSLSMQPEIRVLQEFDEHDGVENTLNDAEQYWIKELKKRGCKLTNCADVGWIKNPKETFRKRSKSNKHQHRSAEVKMKMSISARKRGFLRSSIEAMRLSNIGKKLKQETKEKIRQRALGRKLSEETKEKIRQTLLKRNSNGGASRE